MFERFTERARKVIILAREEAIRLGHNFVGTEHLLLGLIREADGLAVAMLKKLNVDLTGLKREIEKMVAPSKEVSPGSEIPFTPQAKKVLEYAISEARSLGHNYIGTEHLLLGLIREGEGIASLVLRDFGVSVAAAKAQAVELLGEKLRQTTPEGRRLSFEGFTDHARSVIVMARDEASRLGHNSIGPEHLLLGLLREDEGIASRVLRDLGVSVDAAKAKTLELLGEKSPATPSVP